METNKTTNSTPYYRLSERELEVRGLKFRVKTPRRYQSFWQQVQEGKWEAETFAIFEKYIQEDAVYFDIGSWIGPTVLYGAQLAQKCFAFEPDPAAFQALQDNLALNPEIASKVELSNLCISDRCGFLPFGNPVDQEGGNSCSRIAQKEETPLWEVEATTLENFFKKHAVKKCNFIKMDIEGAEEWVIPHIAPLLETFKPTLYLSVHPPHFSEPKKGLKALAQVLEIYPNLLNTEGDSIQPQALLHEKYLNCFYEILATH